ncbi:hypothetical protein BWQ96_04906 [Gracilariopsis chorda]|uniref:C2H2-type domain-containing protein n=1 Tax=Gracilariopsis chorda TaxID=448386 RepID=A0A2V3IT70_9FLOR|nr:hypothetical protein BWQ96_04906 [Gracilariopsis chorda]|eukprot:PXF45316.1 hypothetical protein BWQ96_04906 [Gracilariopsis chorda]
MERRDQPSSDRSNKSSPSSRGRKGRKRTCPNELEMEMAEFMAGMPLNAASSHNSIPEGSTSRDYNPRRDQRAPAHTEQRGQGSPSMKDVLSGPVPSQSNPRAQISPRKRKKRADRQPHGAYSEKEVEIAEFMAAVGSKQQFTEQDAALAMADLSVAPVTATRAVQATAQPASRVQPLPVAGPSQPAGLSQPGPSGASQPGPSGASQPGGAAPPPGVSDEKIRRRECVRCEKRFGSEREATKHRLECKVVLRCSKCNFRARSRGTLAQHESSHYNRRCDVCGFTTDRAKELQNHMDKGHEGGWICETCGQKYLRKSSLALHMKRKHDQQ